MRIHIPNSAFLGNIDPFLKKLDTSDPKRLMISANKRWISIHPVVLSMIAALALSVEKSKIQCEKFEARSSHYLDRMGLFKYLGIKKDAKMIRHEPAGRFIPLTQIKRQDELSRFITDIIPLLHLAPSQAESIRYIVSELVRNVLEHSESRIGAIVSAQYYKKSNTIRIGVVDTGVGIKQTINQSHPARTDMEAIRLALMPGVTGTSKREGGSEQNAGAGLFFIKSIAKVNRDFFSIYSGSAMYKQLKSRHDGGRRMKLHIDPFDDRHSREENLPYWQGTAVGIDMTLETTEAFSTLLDLIRDTYQQAMKERKKARFRKPRFI